MSVPIASSVFSFGGLVVVLGTLVRRLTSPEDALPISAEWLDNLSIDRYRPMLRLLSANDLSFLRSQPGFKRCMASKLRKQRCQIFRSYLRCLAADFHQICSMLKYLMLCSNCDRPDLAHKLLKARVKFAIARIAVEAQVVLYRCGIGNVELAGLVRPFDAMRLELCIWLPAETAAGG